MSILGMVEKFLADGEKGERAAFEAAMIERINTEGFKMSELIFEIYRCQSAIKLLNEKVEKLTKKR